MVGISIFNVIGGHTSCIKNKADENKI